MGIGVFVVAVAVALAIIAYMTWRGSKTNPFFIEAVPETYVVNLPYADIDAYEDLKEKLQRSYAPEALGNGHEKSSSSGEASSLWAQKVPPEERMGLQQALMKRLVACIDPLDQVQRDKPGNWKLWRGKLVSERYWTSLVEAERLVSEEIDICVAEANVLEPGWSSQVFQHALHIWRKKKKRRKRMKRRLSVSRQRKRKRRKIKRSKSAW